DLTEMAEHYVEALLAHQPEGPYLLGGYSMGGYVAYEMARLLHARQHEVALLAILDMRAPYSRKVVEEEDDAAILAGVFRDSVSLSAEHLRTLTTDEQLEYVLNAVGKLKAVPPGFGLAEARRCLNIFKANSQATWNYQPGRYSGRITLFKTAKRLPKAPAILDEEDERYARYLMDPAMGWGEWAGEGVEVIDIP